jgi:hypothetical protein
LQKERDMATEGTAAQVRRYNQSLAGATAVIGELVGILQVRAADVGERQALAEVRGMVSGKNAAELAGLLTAALRQLASREDGHQARPATRPL